eukprot:TRINITY_DN4274_c1_g1_i1.p1 TRINITY_DN4274_c1_g1~~TRINITY_DN4274_c1_g1_i1.p1  ORF type:complete len:822 (+),score=219.72 TRINITY_DN4274_c1_g1_i1:35-2500(+)
MGCCGSSEKPVTQGHEPTKASSPTSPRASPGGSPKSSTHKKQAELKSGVSSPTHNGESNWKRASRQHSQHDISGPHHTYHTKPPIEWRDWNHAFAKKYDIKYEIGKGAYGSVWRASHIESHAKEGHVHAVAAKVVSRKETDDFGWTMALSEMEIIRSLSHPNIVGFRDSFVSNNYIITIMEMCRGGELLCSVSEHVQIYTENIVMRIMTNVLDGLAHMHEMGVCHRDLKPANLLIKKKLRHQEASLLEKVRHELEEKQHETEHPKHHRPAFQSIGSSGRHSSIDMKSPVFHNISGNHSSNFASVSSLRESEIAEYCSDDVVSHLSSSVAICDFGMAVRFVRGEPFPSVCGLVGSPIYCPPELLCLMLKDGKGVMAPLSETLKGIYEDVETYNETCDIWSIGIVTYILLVGYHPFMQEKTVTNLSEIMNSIIVEDITFTEAAWDNISDDAKDFVKLCLERDYEKRIDAKSLQEHRWLKGEGNDVRLRLPVEHHHNPLEMKISLALKTGETFGVTLDKDMKVTYVRPGSAASRSGVEEGMALLGLVGRERQLSIEEVDQALHCDGGASIKLQAGTGGPVHSPIRRLVEAQGVDCNTPRESNHPGLALLRLVIQEREESRWMGPGQSISWDEKSLKASNEIMMTIESSLDSRDGRNKTALQRLMTDLKDHHPEHVWFVLHDSADELDDYVNQLEAHDSFHLRFSIGPRGFLVIGGHGSRDRVSVDSRPNMSGKEMKEFRIEGTNLPGKIIQQLFSQITTEGIDIVWVTRFMTEHYPEYTWIISLGSILGESGCTAPCEPYLNLIYQHHMIHCYGFRTKYLRLKV